MQVLRKSESKLLDRTLVEVVFEGKGGHLTRKDAVTAVAEQLKVGPESVGLIGLQQKSGTSDVWGTFQVYGKADSKKIFHPKHLDVRLLTKEEKEKLKQEKKKAAAPAPAAEAKK